MSIEDKIQELHEKIKEIFPEAVTVKITVNSDAIEVNPKYMTNLNGFSMLNISNNWVRRIE